MSRLQPSFVLGYHGCDEAVGERILQGAPMVFSEEQFDWLGAGAYFWEADPVRAREWAEDKQRRGKCRNPFVIGAVLDLGNCLDAMTRDGAGIIQVAHTSLLDTLRLAGSSVPKNVRSKRYLDCAVVNHAHDLMRRAGESPFDTVRALFPQGEKIYKGAGFQRQTHIQIAVRNPDNIKGIFRVKA